jgi:hypothetical protein
MGKLNSIVYLLLVTIIAISNGCEHNESTISEVENGNFILFVSNQSYHLDPVDIRVYIDNKLAVNQEFYCERQHTWIKFQYNLKEGDHKLYSYTETGRVHIDSTFNLKETPYCVVEFWYDPPPQPNGGTKNTLTVRFSKYHPGFA